MSRKRKLSRSTYLQAQEEYHLLNGDGRKGMHDAVKREAKKVDPELIRKRVAEEMKKLRGETAHG